MAELFRVPPIERSDGLLAERCVNERQIAEALADAQIEGQRPVLAGVAHLHLIARTDLLAAEIGTCEILFGALFEIVPQTFEPLGIETADRHDVRAFLVDARIGDQRTERRERRRGLGHQHALDDQARSEEHTSELQSLMRSAY